MAELKMRMCQMKNKNPFKQYNYELIPDFRLTVTMTKPCLDVAVLDKVGMFPLLVYTQGERNFIQL